MALSRKPIEIVDEGNHQLLTKAGHWERVPLSDVAMVQNGFAFKSELFTHSEGKPLIRIRDIEDGGTENFYSGEYSDEFVVRKGDILIGMDGDFNAAIWQGIDGLLNQRVCRLIPNTKNFSDKFLFLCLQPYLNAINAETSSVTVKHLSSRTIGEIPLPLPPLPEQHRIVAKIEELFSELDKGIGNLKTARAQLKVYRQALLKQAFEGKLTALWREQHYDQLETAAALQQRIQQERAQRYQQQLADWQTNVKQGSLVQRAGKPKSPKPLPPLTAEELAELPELPEGWGWVKLAHIQSHDNYAVKAGPFGSALKKEFYVHDGYKIYGQEQVIRGDSEYGNYFVDASKYKELSSCAVKPFDILISLVGTIGKVLVLPETAKPGIINPRLVKITLNLDCYRASFFKSYFESGFLRSLYAKESQGTTMDILNLGMIQRLPYPLCALEEQKVILELLDAQLSEVDQLELTITTSLQQAEALRQSILKKAFAGLLVPQDPHDEPASKLLARIKAERATVVKNETVAAKARKRSIGDKLSRVEISRLASLNKEPRPC